MPFEKEVTTMSSSRALLFLLSSSSSSFGPRLFLCRSLFLFVLLLLFLLFFSRKSSAREREKRARAKKSMHVNLEQKRRDVSACFRSSVDDFFLLLSLLRCVSFKRTKDQPTNTKEEALKVFCKYIYIYITRGNESRCYVLCARVSLYSSS